MAKRWYVVHAYSGFEKKVMHALKERVALKGMEEYFDEVLVPTEDVVEMRGGQKRKSERKFFPGYVLVHMELNDDTWHLVKETPRVKREWSVFMSDPRIGPLASYPQTEDVLKSVR